MNVQIRYKNGTLTISLGGLPSNGKSGGDPGDEPVGGDPGDEPVGGDPGDEPVGGGAGTGICGLILGPIVIPIGGQSSATGGDPGDEPVGGDPGDEPVGGGGNGSSYGGWSPVVIGPIVFTGCSSGAPPLSGAPSILPRSTPVAVNPPSGIHASAVGPIIRLPFTMEQQQEGMWCWAAVAVSIHNFLHPNAAPFWTQETLATPVLKMEYPTFPAGTDCSKTPGSCNFPAALDDAMNQTGDLAHSGALFNQHLVFSSITKWVDQNLPIGARIVWNAGGAHFIALDGYRQFSSGQLYVHVQDPAYGESFQIYDDLVGNYYPGGVWQDTYLVQSSGPATDNPGGPTNVNP